MAHCAGAPAHALFWFLAFLLLLAPEPCRAAKHGAAKMQQQQQQDDPEKVGAGLLLW